MESRIENRMFAPQYTQCIYAMRTFIDENPRRNFGQAVKTQQQ